MIKRKPVDVYRDVVQRVQHEIFELETQGWKLSEIGEENLKLLHKVLGNTKHLEILLKPRKIPYLEDLTEKENEQRNTLRRDSS